MAQDKCSNCGLGFSETGDCSQCRAHSGMAIAGGSPNGAQTTRQSSRRHRIEQLIAVALTCAGVVAFTAQLPAGSALFLAVGALLYVHSRFVALWSDDD